MGTQETIINRLMKRNRDFDAFWKNYFQPFKNVFEIWGILLAKNLLFWPNF